MITGLCGTQASGKSTACAQLEQHLRALGLTVGVLGLDDLYLRHREGQALAAAMQWAR